MFGPLQILVVAAVLAVSLLGGCSYKGGNFSQPLSQKFQWFGYLDADDIRARCVPGFTAYRLVYNAEYERHVRGYDIWADPEGSARYLARVQTEPSLTEVDLRDPLAPWRWTTSETRVSAFQLEEFQLLLDKSGFRDAAPGGKKLYWSGDYYWLAAGCEDGVMKFNIWGRKDPGFAGLAFPAWLYGLDETGIAVREAREIDPSLETQARLQRSGKRHRRNVDFDISVGDEGLVGRIGP